MLVLGLDPGYANLGYALCDVQVQTQAITPRMMGVIQTESTEVTDALAVRVRALTLRIQGLLHTNLSGQREPGPTVRAVACEINRVVRIEGKVVNHMTEVATVSGALIGLTTAYRIPLVRLYSATIQARVIPGKLRKKLDETDRKKQMESVLRGLFGNVALVARLGGKESHVPASLANHAFDALAVVVAALRTEALPCED